MKVKHTRKNKHNKRRNNRTRKGGCGCGCPSLIRKVHGGNVISSPLTSTVGGKRRHNRRKHTRKGGAAPFVGKGWNVEEVYPPGNYYNLNKYPTLQTNILTSNCSPRMFKGGKTRRNKSRRNRNRKHRGGGITDIIPQDLLNLGRSMKHGMYDLYTDFIPKSHGPSPSVMEQPIDRDYKVIGVPDVDIAAIKAKANQVTSASLK